MKILKATKDVPEAGKGKHAQLWKKVRALKNGLWLPVQLRDSGEAMRLANSARSAKMRARQVKNVLYLRSKG